MTSPLEPTRSLYAGSVGLALSLALLLAARGQASWGLAVTPLAGALVLGLAVQARAPKTSRLWLAVAVLNLLLTVPELALRVADFRFVSGVHFGYPTPADFQEFAPDEELFWKLPSADEHVNSLGFFGPEPALPKPPGVFRALFLGDSCLQQGFPESVPDIIAFLAEQSRAQQDQAERAPHFEALNLSMSGYSSHQGLRVAERFGAQLDPDLVVVYFGWNDHWRAYGAVDREQTVALAREQMFRRSRLLQALRRLAAPSEAPAPLAQNRVPLDQYRENLARLAGLFLERGVPTVFLTAPSAHAARGVPDYLVQRGFAPDPETVLREHAAYNAVAREAAQLDGAFLMDLASEFASQEDPHQVFVQDGIHFNVLGRWAAARRVLAFLSEAGLDGQERAR